MKKVLILTVIVLAGFIWSCGGVKREPSRVYMPDMAYSRAYETYASTANLDSLGIHYDRLPVPGTIKRGEFFPFPYAQDKPGDSTNYVLSRQVQNPLDSMDAGHMKEAERLYLVNCGICHGGNLDGNGPLFASGVYAAKPRDLISDPIVTGMPDGQMFYSITYGKNLMGPYGPQLSTTQRWMIVNYIRSKQAQGKKGASGPGASTTTQAGGDSTAASKTPADTTASR
jgi:mono/diheme cytochrome c family protein